MRGDYKQSEYGKVVLPFTVLRRLDCVLEPTRQAVRDKDAELEAKGIETRSKFLTRVSGYSFYNTSRLDFHSILSDQDQVARNLRQYIGGFSSNAREILEAYNFDVQIDRLDKAGPAVRRDRQVRRGRPASGPDQQPRDGLRLRRADPEVLRDLQ